MVSMIWLKSSYKFWYSQPLVKLKLSLFQQFDRVVNSKKKKLRELREKLRRIEQLKAEGSIEKDDTTGSSSDDDDEKKDHH